MPVTFSENRISVLRLALLPGLITLAVTILRLVGELRHWSKAFFNPEAGGPWSIVGITWLPVIFGIYFAVKLVRANEASDSLLRAGAIAILGWIILIAGQMVARRIVFPHYGFKATLVFVWTAWTLAGLIQFLGWPALSRVLLAYGFAARVPVTLVMFLAFQGRWGTHYDALPPGWTSAGLWSDFLWLGFFPQLTLWVGYTIVAGMLFGSVAGAIMRAAQKSPQTA